MNTVLVIEDDVIVRELIFRALSAEFTVYKAASGIEGLKLALDHHPDLIICDIAMPDMDGYSVLEALRASELTAGISFIFITVFDDRESMRKGMALGADDYLTKPFTIGELRDAVNARMRKKILREAIINRQIDELRSNIALSLPHELRTAIMVVEGYIHLMLEDMGQAAPDQSDMPQSVRDYAGRLHLMAEKFLWYSKAQFADSRQDGHLAEMAQGLIQEVISEIAHDFERTNDLKMQLVDSSLQIHSEHLKKIVGELVENAFKFSEPGTPVLVESHMHQKDFFLKVTDHGRGMTEKQIAKIGAFLQFDRDQYEQQGTGLGLIIAKKLTEAAGGAFSITSEVGHGTTVTIRLLCTEQEIVPAKSLS